MKRLNVSFVILIVVAAIIGIGIYQYLVTQKTTIYLFKDNYQAGTKITEDILISMQIDSSVVNSVKSSKASGGAVYVTANNKKDVIGTKLQRDVFKGTPFMSTLSDKIGGSPAEMRLADGMVGITIGVDNITGGTPLLQPDSRVNIYAGFKIENNVYSEELLLQNVRVISVTYTDLENDKTKTPTISGVTVETTPQNSVKLAYALENGDVRLGIVKVSEYKDIAVTPYTKQVISPAENAEPKSK